MPDGRPVPEAQRVERIMARHLRRGALSIAVFGPGEGEAILVRLPDGQVGVVDGCREPDPRAPDGRGDPVRELLSELAQESGDPDDFRLAFVCLTHPHKDHYRGQGRLLDAYRRRVDRVWSPSPYSGRYAQAYTSYVKLTRAGRSPLPDDHDPKGLERVFTQQRLATREYGSQPTRAYVNRSLWETRMLGQALEVKACGPYDGDVEWAEDDLVNCLTRMAEGEEVSQGIDPNWTSAALLIRWGGAGVLLAGDLLYGPEGRCRGWDATHGCVEGPVQVVNMAHHGSRNAHHDELWRRLEPALAMVTPFKMAGGSNPPRPEMVQEYARCACVVITAPPRWEGDGARMPFPFRDGSFPSPSPGADAIRNAAAVSLDAQGEILSLTLAGKADIYRPRSEVQPDS